MKNVYEKLKNKDDVDILIIGDSIAYGSISSSFETSWAGILKNEIPKTFGSKVTITNISVGGTDSLFGYIALMRQNFYKIFDLVILCHGQNDNVDEFSVNYEGLLTAALRRNPKCEVLCVLESSQRSYTQKIKTILDIAKHYNCAVADTIAEFNSCGIDFSNLVAPDMVHPNDDGHKLYAKSIIQTLLNGVNEGKNNAELKNYLNDKTAMFEKYSFISTHDMKRCENSLFVTAKGRIICYNLLEAPNGSNYAVYLNFEKIESHTVRHDYEWVWERSYKIKNICENHNFVFELKFEDFNDIERVTGISIIG